MNNLISIFLETKNTLKKTPAFLHKFHHTSNGSRIPVYIKNSLLNNGKKDFENYFNLKEIHKLIDNGSYQEAKDYLEKIVLLNNVQEKELRVSILFLLARCYYGLGSLDDALLNLDEAISYQPDNIEVLKLKADCLLELGKWQEAILIFHKLLRLTPSDDKILYRLGNIYMFYGEYEEALICFKGCCKLRPSNSDYWEMKAEMLVKLNILEEACYSYNKALRLGGKFHILPRLAYCYAITGNIIKAQKLLIKALKIEPDNYEVLCNLAAIYHKLDKNDQAYRLFYKAYNLNQNDPILLNNLGYVCFKLGRTRKAIEYYNQALKIEPSNITILYNLSNSFLAKGQLEEACKTLEKIISIDSENSSAWALLGNAYEQLSKYNIAVDCYNKSLKLAE